MSFYSCNYINLYNIKNGYSEATTDTEYSIEKNRQEIGTSALPFFRALYLHINKIINLLYIKFQWVIILKLTLKIAIYHQNIYLI